MSQKKIAQMQEKGDANPPQMDVHELCSGKDGIVWATCNGKQAEIIRNALLAQQIHAGLT